LDALCLAVKGNQHVAASVAILFGSRGPTHVARFVIAIVINAVNRITFFAVVGKLGNVVVKCLKIMSPLVADEDAPPPVIRIPGVAWRGASPDY